MLCVKNFHLNHQFLRDFLYLASFMGALTETCTSWNVLSILMGPSLAMFFSLAVFHFAVSDGFCIFETFFSETEIICSLLFDGTTKQQLFWVALYLSVIYASFMVFFPYNFMHMSYQTSLFLYVYVPSLYAFVPAIVNCLILPAVLTVTLNAFNKVCSLVSQAYKFCHVQKVTKDQSSAYHHVMWLTSRLLCLFLTLSFSESIYLSLQYGVAHYSLMHHVDYSLTHLQELLLVSTIVLSTFSTMSAVSYNLASRLFEPYQALKRDISQFRDLSWSSALIYAWGYFTIMTRSFVRGVQTTSIGQGIKQIMVSFVDKGRRNAPAYLMLRPVASKSINPDSTKTAKRSSDPSYLRLLKRFHLA